MDGNLTKVMYGSTNIAMTFLCYEKVNQGNCNGNQFHAKSLNNPFYSINFNTNGIAQQVEDVEASRFC